MKKAGILICVVALGLSQVVGCNPGRPPRPEISPDGANFEIGVGGGGGDATPPSDDSKSDPPKTGEPKKDDPKKDESKSEGSDNAKDD